MVLPKSTPIYAQVELGDNQIERAKRILRVKGYNHSEWFFGSKKVDRWFGYTFGYKICKAYSARISKKSSDLVNTAAELILDYMRY